MNVSGRQFIKTQITNTSFPNDPERDDKSQVEVDQQLKVRIRGSIADDLLEIEIDFDDSLPSVERQKTRVFYNGRKRDVGLATLQANAKFGDVQLSLPGSNFVSYNKSVFGISGQMHFTDFSLGGWGPKQLSFYGIASEKKGETQKKEFTGKNRRRIPDPLPDVNPIRRTYYQPLADTQSNNRSLPIQVNSEEILLDDRNAENNDDNTLTDYTVSNPTTGETYTGDFEQLDAGEDYSIDYQKGVIRFKQNVQQNYVLAVSLTKNDGSRLTDFMIKDQDESDSFDRYHLLNRYQLASQNIVRDDPDRVLEIRDASDASRPNGGQSYAQILGVDNDGNGVIDDEFIDFELGVLRFPDTEPFTSRALENNGAETNPTVYGPPSQRDQLFEIYQEVLVEENTYTLGVNVVRDSEKVVVDGQALERGRDYTIDYQTGFISFFDSVSIDEETKIEITYEQQGVGAVRSETFFGGRIEGDVSENLSMGSTLLTSQEDERDEVPQVGRGTKSTSVSEFDITWSPTRDLQRIIGWWGDETWESYPWDDDLKLDVSYDWAESSRDPNQEGKALVDDFSQLDRRIPFSKNEFDWSPADPIQQFSGPRSPVLEGRSSVNFDEVDGSGHDPDPDEEDSQTSVRVSMPMGSGTDPDTWASFQQLFASNGEDLRGFDYLEFWVKWEKNAEGGTLSVDLGEVTENTDRGGLLTEDDNDNQILNPGEDDGYQTFDFLFGDNNGQLDSEDLDQNGRLDEEEGYLHFPDVNKTSTVDTGTTSHGWTLYKIPLTGTFGEARGNPQNRQGGNLSDTPTRDEVLQNARMVRLVYEAPNKSGSERSFLLEQMGAVSTRWKAPQDTTIFRLDTKTSAEDDRLPAPTTADFSEDDRLEKGMSFIFDSVDQSDSELTRATIDFPGGEEIRNFKTLKLLFNTNQYPTSGPGNGDTGFLRFGTDNDNFFQYNFPYQNPSSDPNVESLTNGWFLLNVDLTAFEQDLIDKSLSGIDTLRRGNRLTKGDPTLLDVKRYTVGMIAPSGTTISGELLFEGLSLADVREESGEAQEFNASMDVADGFLNLNGTDREIDGEFRTIGLVNNSISNQFVAENELFESLSGSLDLNRLIPDQWGIGVPMDFSWSSKTTEIPPDRIERIQTEDVGKVETINRGINSGLNTDSLYPNFSVSWSDKDKQVTQEQQDKEFTDLETDLGMSGNYSVSFEETVGGFLPIGEQLTFSTQGNYGLFEEKRRSFGSTDVDTTTRDEVSRGLSTTFESKPSSWLQTTTRLSFNDLNRETERISGLISRNHSLDFSLEPSGFFGIKPSYSLGTSINENYDRQGNVQKSVGLNGNTNLSINTVPTEWWQELDFLSLTYRYSISSSARYNDLDNSFGNSTVYSDFYNGLSWVFTGPDLDVSSDTLSLSRNRGSKNLTHSLGGDLKFFKPLDTRYDLNFSQNFGQTDNSVNQTDVTSFALNNRIQLRSVSSFFNSWTRDASMNLNYSFSRSETEDSEENTHKPTFQLSTRWNKFWSTNFNLRTTLGEEVDRQVTRERFEMAPSFDFNWLINEKADEGTLWFDNRFEITGGLSGQVNEVTRNDETRQDDWEMSGNFGGSYNITNNIKTRFGGRYSVFRDDFRETNDRNSFGVDASLDFRF